MKAAAAATLWLLLALLPVAAEDPPAAFAWVGSDSCRSCHQDHYASWYRTYHRTMTQEASEKSVLGAFDGREVSYWGRTIRPIRRDGKFLFEYLDPDTGALVGVAEIKRTVGSHRYQQYLAQAPNTGENYIRMHLLWHIAEQRWVHMNAAFLYNDDQGFDDHVSTWNHNCIYCHNTGPQPNIRNYEELHRRLLRGESLNFLNEARYESQVAELGIACESCHGPGAEHARAMRNPLTRYWHQFNPQAKVPGIVNPASLSPQRSSEVCGQCHAQRVPADIDLVETWLKTGPTYRAGAELEAHVDYVTAETPGPPGRPGLYRLRFWSDGTPRLSAYEFTGLQRSACYRQGEAGCIACHQGHGGEPEGMISEANREGASCQDCHQPIAADIPAHTRHAPDSEASRCVSCHMPRMVYGVMAIHRSHDIEVPEPLVHAAADRPGACNSCHLHDSAHWAAQAIAGWNGATATAARQDEPPEWLRQLLGGDPVQRAIAAEAAGQPGIAVPTEQRLWLIPPLLHAMADPYPAVRRFAANSLRSLDGQLPGIELGKDLSSYDFIADPGVRREIERQLWRAWRKFATGRVDAPVWIRDARVAPVLLADLRARAGSQAQQIEIGE